MQFRFKPAITVLTVVGLVFAIFASTASAECGPGFTNKQQLIRIVEEHPEIAQGMRRELLAEPKSGYQADETVLNYLRDPHQKAKVTPHNYELSTNTECPEGLGQYIDCGGCLLGNMPGKVMLWHCSELGGGGRNCIPILKGYCMNFVTGPPAFPPKHPPCKCQPPKKPPRTVIIHKTTLNKEGHTVTTPMHTFQWRVTAPGYRPKVVIMTHNPQFVGKYRSGTCVTAEELSPMGTEKWKVVGQRRKTICVGQHWVKFQFVNKEKGVEKTPPPEPIICSENQVINGDVCGGTCNSTTIIVGSGNTVNNEVNCEPEKPKEEPKEPPVEVEKYTEISCTGFEEVSGGASFLVDCEVNTNTGKPISLEAHSNDENSRVSGINCYSNGGSQTCPSTGGTFEFRVTGRNSGSTILYSSITAVASAGGVESKPFTSDPFPVDPEEGGF